MWASALLMQRSSDFSKFMMSARLFWAAPYAIFRSKTEIPMTRDLQSRVNSKVGQTPHIFSFETSRSDVPVS